MLIFLVGFYAGLQVKGKVKSRLLVSVLLARLLSSGGGHHRPHLHREDGLPVQIETGGKVLSVLGEDPEAQQAPHLGGDDLLPLVLERGARPQALRPENAAPPLQVHLRVRGARPAPNVGEDDPRVPLLLDADAAPVVHPLAGKSHAVHRLREGTLRLLPCVVGVLTVLSLEGEDQLVHLNRRVRLALLPEGADRLKVR